MKRLKKGQLIYVDNKNAVAVLISNSYYMDISGVVTYIEDSLYPNCDIIEYKGAPFRVKSSNIRPLTNFEKALYE